jgi:hypothetical protein
MQERRPEKGGLRKAASSHGQALKPSFNLSPNGNENGWGQPYRADSSEDASCTTEPFKSQVSETRRNSLHVPTSAAVQFPPLWKRMSSRTISNTVCIHLLHSLYLDEAGWLSSTKARHNTKHGAVETKVTWSNIVGATKSTLLAEKYQSRRPGRKLTCLIRASGGLQGVYVTFFSV